MLDLSHHKSEEPLLDDEPDTPTFIPTAQSNKTVIRKLSLVFMLSFTFMLIEIVGGIFSNSLAILADAGHLFSDLLGFLISIISVWISGLPADMKHSYGYHRAGVIGALASVMIIWGLTGFLVYYAVQRVINIDTINVDGKIMFFTACFGLLTNLTMIKVLNWESEMTQAVEEPEEEKKISKQNSRRGSKEKRIEDIATHLTQAEPAIIEASERQEEDYPCQNELYSPPKIEEFNDQQLTFKIRSMGDVEANRKDEGTKKKNGTREPQDVKENFNIRATIIHIIGDMIQSIGVILGAGLIWLDPRLKLADPIITFLFSIIVMITTIRIVRDCMIVLMEATPSQIDIAEFKEKLKSVEGVVGLHDFHVWSLSEDKPSMSAHIYTNADQQIVLKRATKICRLYGIYHSTIQIETVDDSKHRHYVNCGHDLH